MAKDKDKDRELLKSAAQLPDDAEARRMRLKTLIKLGKESGFLT